MKTIKIIIVDDHKIFRDGLNLALSTIDKVKVVAEAESGINLLKILKKQKPQIIFMDISLPDTNGILLAQKVLEVYSNVKIIILSSYNNIEIINESIQAGVSGYLLKNTDYNEIVTAIDTVLDDNIYFSTEIVNVIIKNKKEDFKTKRNKVKKEALNLTKRQIEILSNICQGFDNKTIAILLHVSERTVEKHTQNIMNKTNTNSKSKLIIFALRNNILEL